MADSTRPPSNPSSAPSCASSAHRSAPTLLAEFLAQAHDAALIQELRHVGIDLGRPHAVMAMGGVPAADTAAMLQTCVHHLRVSLFGAVASRPAAAFPYPVAIVLPVGSPSSWTAALTATRKAVASLPLLACLRPSVSGPERLIAEHRTAVADLALAIDAGETGGVFSPGALAHWRAVANLDDAEQQCLMACLAPIVTMAPKARDAYLATADALIVEGMRQSDAARQLHVHTNGVRYRAARIEELTGLRFNNGKDRLQLALALKTYRLRMRSTQLAGPNSASTRALP